MRELMLVCWSTRRSLGLALLALATVLAMNGSLMAERLDGDLLPPKRAGTAKLEAKSIMIQVYKRKLSRQALGSGLKQYKEERKCVVKQREPLAMAHWALPALKTACSVGLILGATVSMPHRCVSLGRACASLAC